MFFKTRASVLKAVFYIRSAFTASEVMHRWRMHSFCTISSTMFLKQCFWFILVIIGFPLVFLSISTSKSLCLTRFWSIVYDVSSLWELLNKYYYYARKKSIRNANQNPRRRYIYHLEYITSERRPNVVKSRSYVIFWATQFHEFYVIMARLPP